VCSSDLTTKNRKMVIPAAVDLVPTPSEGNPPHKPAELARDRYTSQAQWLAACFFAFDAALGVQP
jgi:hypothetical protein